MINLNTVQGKVEYLLRNHPQTRKSDNNLILAVYIMIDSSVKNNTFKEVMLEIDSNNSFPSFESIRRCRQKLQASYPELKDDFTSRKRKSLEKEYKKYAKE